MAAVAAFVKDGKVLCGLRHYGPEKVVWTIPGGRCDDNETVADTLRREVCEEVGFQRFEIQEFLGEIPGAKAGDTVYVFRCTTEEEPKLMEPHKFSRWEWLEINNLPPNLINVSAFEFLKKSV